MLLYLVRSPGGKMLTLKDYSMMVIKNVYYIFGFKLLQQRPKKQLDLSIYVLGWHGSAM